MVVLPVATAAPRGSQVDLEKLGTQVSQLDEQLNQAKIELDQLNRQLADARRTAKVQFGSLDRIQSRIAVQAAAEYKGSGLGSIAALLSGADSTTLVQKAETLNLLAQQDGDLLAAARAEQQIYEAAVAEVQRAKAAQNKEVAGIAKRKGEIERKLNQLERLRSEIGDPRSASPTSGAPPGRDRSTARGSPCIRGPPPASACRTLPPPSTARSRTSPRARWNPETWCSSAVPSTTSGCISVRD